MAESSRFCDVFDRVPVLIHAGSLANQPSVEHCRLDNFCRPTDGLGANFIGDGLLIAYKYPLLRHPHTLVIRIAELGTLLSNESRATHNEDHPQRGKLGTPCQRENGDVFDTDYNRREP